MVGLLRFKQRLGGMKSTCDGGVVGACSITRLSRPATCRPARQVRLFAAVQAPRAGGAGRAYLSGQRGSCGAAVLRDAAGRHHLHQVNALSHDLHRPPLRAQQRCGGVMPARPAAISSPHLLCLLRTLPPLQRWPGHAAPAPRAHPAPAPGVQPARGRLGASAPVLRSLYLQYESNQMWRRDALSA